VKILINAICPSRKLFPVSITKANVQLCACVSNNDISFSENRVRCTNVLDSLRVVKLPPPLYPVSRSSVSGALLHALISICYISLFLSPSPPPPPPPNRKKYARSKETTNLVTGLRVLRSSKKVKSSRYRPGVAQRVGRGIALLSHDRGTRRGWVVSSTLRTHFTHGKESVPILQEAGWVPGPIWTGGISRPHRDSIPDRPSRSQSLYRLSYRAHYFEVVVQTISEVLRLKESRNLVSVLCWYFWRQNITLYKCQCSGIVVTFLPQSL